MSLCICTYWSESYFDTLWVAKETKLHADREDWSDAQAGVFSGCSGDFVCLSWYDSFMFLTFFFSCSREGNLFTVDLFHFLEPLNKCMYVSFIQQCGGVLLIWVTVGPAALPAALGWGVVV